MPKNLKECSRESFGLGHEGNPRLEDINTSCLLRIADAVENQTKNLELIAVKYVRMEKDLDFYSRGYKQRGETISGLEKSNVALRGVITRMKKQKGESK